MRLKVLALFQLALLAAIVTAFWASLLDWLIPYSLVVAVPYFSGLYRLVRKQPVDWDAELALVLGMCGTVVGLIFMVSNIDPQSVREIESAVQVVASVLYGLGIALQTTLVGIIVWLLLVLQERLLR